MTIGQRIKERRLYLGLSADYVGSQLGKDRSTVYRYESDEIEKLPISILEPLASVLRTTPAYLMGWTENDIISPTGMVAVYGQIPAGCPALAVENIEGYYPIMLPHPEEYFFLRVNGDSMINAGINDKSLVLLHKQNSAQNV